jgi:serine phosphatase RsbU (regulator of sigma subunit)/anti-sigma regulatory factor (Ser/Thr protein kinase)
MIAAGTRRTAVLGRTLTAGVDSVRDRPLRLVPAVVLIVSAVAVAFSSPESHYGLFFAAAPLIAAAVHGIQVTAVVGALSVGLDILLQHQVSDGESDVWLLKLAFVVSTALLALFIGRSRLSDRRLAESRAVALTLQRGLLPRRFRETTAVEVSHRYVPADTDAGVGGDWFDGIQLSGARVALVVGDVMGHGVHAAAMMGRLRAAMHALAGSDFAPEEVLVRMDDLVQRLAEDTREEERGASCIYLIYDPISRRCTVAGAGHPPPALVPPDGRVDFPALPENPPLGVDHTPFESVEMTLPEGTLIALYTDGLLDLRRRSSDEAFAWLGDALTHSGGSLEETCARVVSAVPRAQADDDVALLLARTRVVDAERVAHWDLPPEPRSVATARSAATRQLAAWGLEDSAFLMELVVSELVTNSIRHASGPIALRLIHDHSLICEVSDASSTAPHLRHARLLDEGGRGLFLVGHLTDRWGTRYTENGKMIWAEKSLPAPARITPS